VTDEQPAAREPLEASPSTSVDDALAALAEREAWLREAQEIARIGSFRWDAASGRVVWSDELYRLFGKVRGEFVPTFEGYVSCIHEADRGNVVAALQRCFAEGSTFEHEYRAAPGLGPERWLHARGRTRRGANGEPVGLEGTCQDITERKRAEALIAGLEAQVRTAQKMEALGRLSGGIAHDFNNILAIIDAHVEQAMSSLDERHPSYEPLVVSRQAAARAVDLVRRILSFSRQDRPQPRPLPVADALAEVARFLRPILPASIALTRRIEGAPPPVLADATQLHQALINLCTNAWHAIEPAAGSIELRGAWIDGADATPPSSRSRREGWRTVGGVAADRRYVRISVIDDGCGMDDATLERIFDPFFTTKPAGRGTGLGLSAVHGIVASHGGFVTVESRQGAGTRVHVHLPAADPHAPVVAGADPGEPGAKLAATPTPGARSEQGTSPADPHAHGAVGGGQTVFYVDDEPVLAAVVERALVRHGFSARAFTSSRAALAAIEEVATDAVRPALVITDMNMPEVSGMRVARAARARTPPIPVIMISGHVTEEVRAEAEALGVERVLLKPISARELARAASTVLSAVVAPG
jgi:two-component system cell cycle sensor histidine kinase/response regulator CckA